MGDVAVRALAEGEARLELSADGLGRQRSEAAEPVAGGGLVEGLGGEVLAQQCDHGVVRVLPPRPGGLGEALGIGLGEALGLALRHEVAEPVGARGLVGGAALGRAVRCHAARSAVIVDPQRSRPLAERPVLPDLDLEERLGVESELDPPAGQPGSHLEFDAAQGEHTGFVRRTRLAEQEGLSQLLVCGVADARGGLAPAVEGLLAGLAVDAAVVLELRPGGEGGVELLQGDDGAVGGDLWQKRARHEAVERLDHLARVLGVGQPGACQEVRLPEVVGEGRLPAVEVLARGRRRGGALGEAARRQQPVDGAAAQDTRLDLPRLLGDGDEAVEAGGGDLSLEPQDELAVGLVEGVRAPTCGSAGSRRAGSRPRR